MPPMGVMTAAVPEIRGEHATAFAIAYVVGVPVIFFLAPVARRLTAGLLGAPQ